MTYEEMREALLEYRGKRDNRQMEALLRRVAGVDSMADVPEGKRAAVVEACAADDGGDRSAARPTTLTEIGPRAFAKWNSAKRRPRDSDGKPIDGGGDS